MRTRVFSTVTLVAVAFTFGALLGRRWRGDFADNVLSAIALITLAFVVVAAWDYASRIIKQAARPAKQPTKGPRRPPLEFRLSGKHLGCEYANHRLGLRLQEMGRLEFFQVDLKLPQSWRGNETGTGSAFAALEDSEKVAVGLFALALGIYAATRLVALDQFPIYFFTDEAIHPVLAVELVRDGFRDAAGRLFPSYFQNGLYWNLSLSVYLHLLPTLLFGKSIVVTRAVSALISLFGAAAAGLILKWFFKLKWWWVVVLLLTVTPAWFLHSRTAFETVLMVSFYAWFMLFYLLYRHRSPTYLYAALVCGAATFYSYSNGQAVMAASGILLLLSDFRYHLRNWRAAFWGFGILILLALPYFSFRYQHPEALVSQLRILDSYWLKQIPLGDKLHQFFANYLYGLSPQYWFLPNENDLIRHRMKDYGNLSLWLLPFFLAGILVCLRHIKSSAHRTLLIAALAAPFGSALAEISITRALLFVIPANLFGAVGFEWFVARLKSIRLQWSVALAAFVVLSGLGIFMLRDALGNGPTWYTNYGLFGMQWGTRQLFAQAIPDYARRHPDSPIYLSSTWANGADMFLRYFPVDPQRVQMLNVDYFMAYKRELDPRAVFIMTKEEVDRARTSQKFKTIDMDQTIPYPDASDGFYFAHLQYVDNVDAVFASEQEARRQLVSEPMVINGKVAQVAHSVLDIGRVQDMFDGDPFTLARGREANPFIIDITFAEPQAVHSLAATFGKMNFKWTASVYSGEEDAPMEYTAQYTDLVDEPHVEMRFSRGPEHVSRLRIEILDLNSIEPVHVHVRELTIR